MRAPLQILLPIPGASCKTEENSIESENLYKSGEQRAHIQVIHDRGVHMGMKSSESDLPFFDCEPPEAGECLRFCRPFFMTSPFFGFGLPGGRGAGGAVFCFFDGLTHVSSLTERIFR